MINYPLYTLFDLSIGQRILLTSTLHWSTIISLIELAVKLAASSKEILNVWRLAPTVTITKGMVIVKCAGTKAHKLSEIFNWSAILNNPNPSTICGNTIGEIIIAWIDCLPFLGPRSNPKATKVPRIRDNGVTIIAIVRLRKVAFCQSWEEITSVYHLVPYVGGGKLK